MTEASNRIDLATCEQEPIRIPGAVQPHGFLLSLDTQLKVLQASDNLAQHIGMAPEHAVGQPLGQVIGMAACELLQARLRGGLRERPDHVGLVQIGPRRFDVLAHAYDGLVIAEFEPLRSDAPTDLRHLYPLVGDFLHKINDADSVVAMSELAGAEIRGLTGFDRVMVYRFDHEGHGTVLAEAGRLGPHSYLGQRFPASDIPRQARELYVANRIRLIQSADYTAARLVPPQNPLSGKPNDLSFAALRSVSPVHLQYMRNMGTLASMSISLVVKGRLWGLVSCHHGAPRHVNFDQRTVCEQLGQILALRIETREDADELQLRLEVRRVMVSMLAGLTKGSDFIDNMQSVLPQLLRFGRAGGAAIVVDERLVTYGDTPDQEQIRALVSWLDLQAQDELFHTDRLSVLFAPAGDYTRVASGLMAMSISRIHKHYLLWFRPEIVRTIDWAGNPHSKSDGMTQLSPRTSFETWRETIHASSAPWHGGEIELALEFRTALLGIALERAEQMAELAEELGRANKELEAFSYSVSHDLRAPLRHIVGFADLLLEAAGNDSTEKRQRFLQNIKESARLAGKLVDDLLSFSQMGRASLRPTRVNMNDMVRACIDKLGIDTRGRNVDWRVADLPAICADPTFLQLAIYNLLSNAVKFTGQRDPAVIEVSASAGEGETVFKVSDNGVGFNMEYAHKLFGVFQRLHRMEDFQGTGIGLANVRRIVERHGGRVWAESSAGQGATFWFTIPAVIPLSVEGNSAC